MALLHSTPPLVGCRPRRLRRSLGQLLVATGLVLGLVGVLVPSASAIVQPGTIPNDVWNADWDDNGPWPPSDHAGWPVPAANPGLPERCGIDIAVIVDRSGSIADAGQATAYKSAVKDLIDAFTGTPSRLGVWSFGQHASDTDATSHPWHQMAELDGPNGATNATALKSTVDSIPIVSNESTNWEEGIRSVITAPVAASPHPDLVVVLTDGQPTVHADDLGSGGETDNDDMAGGVASANLVKASGPDGTRILAVGVGDDVEEAGLALISGPTEFGTDTTDIAQADYLTTSFADLSENLEDFATELCGGGVTVTKLVSTPQQPDVYAPAAGWGFTGSLAGEQPPTLVVTPDDGVTDGSGQVVFEWSSPGTQTITITESQQPGFDLVEVACTLDQQPVGQAVPNGVTLQVSQDDDVQCTFKNRPQLIDLSVLKDDGLTTAEPGDVLDYTITYENTPDALGTAENVVLSETVPEHTTFDAVASTPGWSCADGSPAGTVCTLSVGSLGPDEGGTAHFVVRVDDAVPATANTIVNTVTITGEGPERDEDDQTDTDIDALHRTVDLGVTKDDGGITAEPGDEVTYTIAYRNVGTADATGVVLTETVPTGSSFVGPAGWTCVGATCTFPVGDLPAGAEGSVAFTVQVDEELPAGQTDLDNVVVIGDDGEHGDDPNPGDNTATDDTPVELTEVLGNVVTRGRPAGTALARTGSDTDRLLLAAGLLTILGGLLLVGESLADQRRRRFLALRQR